MLCTEVFRSFWGGTCLHLGALNTRREMMQDILSLFRLSDIFWWIRK